MEADDFPAGDRPGSTGDRGGAHRTIFERNPEIAYWSFTSLENGIHSCCPGHGGYPASYDTRTGFWYDRAKEAQQDDGTMVIVKVK